MAIVISLAGLAALAAVGLRSSSGSPTEAGPRARVYRDVDVCLLTGPQGLAADPARQVWHGLQALSRNGSVRLSYVSVSAPDTPDTAGPFLAGLIQRRCAVIVASGAAEVAAVDAAAGRAPGVRFVSLTSHGVAHANLTTLDPAAPALDTAVTGAVRTLVGG